MADITVVPNQFSRVTHVLTIVTAKTPGGVKVSDVVRVSGPIRLHLREKVGLENPLCLADSGFDRVCFLRVELTVVRPIKTIETGRDCVERLLLCRVRPIQHLDYLPFQIRQRRVELTG